jgi:signal transduction histidine kinase/CheY-like chemotaxis protein
MNFFSESVKYVNVKKKLSFSIIISIATILLIAYFYVDGKIYLKFAAGLLFVVTVVQVFALQFFLKSILKNEIIKENLNSRLKELKIDLKKAENLAEHKSIYLANMSYEVRTPLNTVLGMLNMFKQTSLDSDQVAQVEIAEFSSMHLLQLVKMVTDNAEVDAGDVKLNFIAIDLKQDLVHLFKVFEYQAWEKGLKFDFKFLGEEKDKSLVYGDSSRIQQVLINLINNAIKFTNSGKISIIIDQTIGLDQEQIVTFYVKDTGVGMRSDEVKRFFANENDTSPAVIKDYRGAGLGLSISRKLVRLMGGTLKLESKQNEGSTFYFSLQLKKTLNLNVVKEAPANLQAKFNVLVAEDNRMNQKVIKFLLEKQGADCTFAKNGVEAVDLYNILDFDLIFMDIYMPGMDGYQATKEIIKTKKYAQHKTPIIAVSASAFEEDIENAKQAGANDFLSKPIKVDKLQNLLTKYVL